MSVELPYGLRDGRLVHISEVSSGLECGCYCPACGCRLVARKGVSMAHHFAHSGTACAHGMETILHLAAKETVTKCGGVWIPHVSIGWPSRNGGIYISPRKFISLSRIELEFKCQGIVPDILGFHQGVPLAIEIFVTHKVDDIKKMKIKEGGISTFEIDLSFLKGDFRIEELSDIVIEKGKRKWLYNSYSAAIRYSVEEMLIGLPFDNNGYLKRTGACPHRGPKTKTSIAECFSCKFCYSIMKSGDLIESESIYQIGRAELSLISVYCLGYAGLRNFEDYKRLKTEKYRPEHRVFS